MKPDSPTRGLPAHEETSGPFWSVMIPTYNRTKYLEQTLRSVLEQDLGPDRMQIEVVDNCSTEGDPEALVRSVGRGRVSFHRQSTNVGMTGNWNTCVSRARGLWVHILNDDDMAMPGFYESHERLVRGHAGVDLVFSSARVIDGEGEYVYTHEPYPESVLLPGPREAKKCLLEGNHIGGPSSVAVRAAAYERVGAFNEETHFHSDQEMWIRVLLEGDAYFQSTPLVAIRQHDGSETRRLERTRQVESETRKFLTSCLNDEQMRSLLSESELAELRARLDSLSGGGGRPTGSQVLGKLKSKTPPYIRKALSPLYRKLRAGGKGAGGDS